MTKEEKLELMAKLGISPDRYDELLKISEEPEKDPEIIAIFERKERFKNGTQTAEDIAWLEEGEKHDPYKLTSYHTSL
jgi:hypothetical protein